MKRGVLFSLLLAIAALSAFAQNAKQLSGIIKEITGEVELKRAGAYAFVKAKTGDTVAADTIISTGFKSTAIIEIGSSTIAVRPLTRLTLTEIKSISDTETLNISLQTGRVKIDVKPPAGTKANFTVQSPSATASVRGTSFEFDTCNLRVNEGRVAFQGSKGKGILVPSGMTSSVDADGRAVDPLGVSDISATRSSLKALSTPAYGVDITIEWE
ncbi:hypothetical protein R84B8_00578 [Treponema sp. R8-4-B8]